MQAHSLTFIQFKKRNDLIKAVMMKMLLDLAWKAVVMIVNFRIN